MREFVESEIILPEGPRAGLPFRVDFSPFVGLVLDAFDSGRFRRHWITGPVQSGKSLAGLVMPTMYHLFEVGESVILGAPTMQIAQGVYQEKILPVIQRSRFAHLLPKKGRGARGGLGDYVRFGNGAILRFMGGGGGDEQRSSFTARVVVITEADKMDEAGAVSREADPVTQLEARSRAFGERALLYAECTISTTTGRINREITDGTDTKLALRCPHCCAYVVPVRECLSGWQGCEDAIAARSAGMLACPSCGAAWTEADRDTAQHSPAFVHRGQEIHGEAITGEPPRTNTFGFKWNVVASPLTSIADVSEMEWRADRSESIEDLKALHQFVWALPFDQSMAGSAASITRDMVLNKITRHKRGIMPDGFEAVTVGVDLGLYWCWYATWAWKSTMEGHLMDYGLIEVPQERQADPVKILSALRAFRDQTLSPGWATVKGEQVRPRVVLVDAGGGKTGGGFREIAYTFARETLIPGVTCLPSQGMGTGRDQASWNVKDGDDGWKISPQPNARLVLLNADRWKREVHEGFAAPPGAPGSLGLYHAEMVEHIRFAKHIVAERQEEVFDPGKGMRTFWNKVHRDNHLLDCSMMALGAARMLGYVRTRPDALPQKPKAYAAAGKRGG